MKMADGGFRPAYNVQFASDTRSGAVAGVAVDNSGSDMGKMAPMNAALAKDYGERPRQHLADGGYVKFDDIEELEKAGVDVYAPVPAPRDKSRDRYAPQQDDAPAIAAWRKRMNEDVAKEIYKERAATAERPGAQSRPAAVSRVRRGQGQINRAHARLDAQHGVRLASDRDLRRANTEQKRDGRKDGHRQLSFLKPMGQERAARHAPHHSCAIRQTPQAIPTTPIPTIRLFGPASYPPRPVAAFAATKAPRAYSFSVSEPIDC